MVSTALTKTLKASGPASQHEGLPLQVHTQRRVAATASNQNAGMVHGALQQQLNRTHIEYRAAFITAGTIQKRLVTDQLRENARLQTALRERLPALSTEMSLLREEHVLMAKQLHSSSSATSPAATKSSGSAAKQAGWQEDLQGLQQVNDTFLFTAVRWGGLLQEMQTPWVSQDGLLYAYQDRILELEGEKEGLLQQRLTLLEDLASSMGPSSKASTSLTHYSAVSDAAMRLAQQSASQTKSASLQSVWRLAPWLALEMPPCTVRHDAFTDVHDSSHEGAEQGTIATYLGQRVAIRVAAYDDEKMVPAMQREIAVLQCLTALDLGCIPALIAHGTLVHDTGQQQLFMATSHIQGHSLLSTETLKKLQGSIPDLDAWRTQISEAALLGDFELSDRLQAEWDSMQPTWEQQTSELAKAVSKAAFAALRQLHSMLIVHGDIQPANVLVEFQEGGGIRVVLIDWQKAVPGAVDVDMEEEVDSMKLAIRRLCENLHLSKQESKAVLSEGRLKYQRQAPSMALETSTPAEASETNGGTPPFAA